jgi:uncharacterized protein with GYD domain
MATFIVLVDYTEQGLENIQDSPSRAAAFTETAKAAGVTVKDIYWTVGEHDGIAILDAPDEETAARVVLGLARTGNVRTRTLRAFDRDEMARVVGG